MTTLRFTKMHGLGNDFVVIDAIHQQVALSAPQLRLLADRHFGVGCDQVLLVERATHVDADFRYRIFNADGFEVEQCGNGARCFVKFVRDEGLTDQRVIRVETAGGLIAPELLEGGEVRVNMGEPRLLPVEIPFVADEESIVYRVEFGGEKSGTETVEKTVLDLTVVSMGNPHAVQVVADVNRAPVTTEGPRIEHHPRFPEGVNAGYMQVLDRATIALRVWERGVGETMACGTGACAAVVAGIRRGLLSSPVSVHTRGGTLVIEWPGAHSAVQMTGPAATVFAGEWQVPASDEATSVHDKHPEKIGTHPDER